MFKAKPSIIIGAVTLCLGLVSWIIGGSSDKVLLLYIFPRSAISIGFMYFLWGLSFAFIGIVIGGIAFGCEKYKHHEAMKIVVFLVISYLFMFCVHPMFFKCLAPFMTFIVLLASLFFCFFALLSSIKMYSLWSLCLIIHLMWVFYNSFLALTIALIN